MNFLNPFAVKNEVVVPDAPRRAADVIAEKQKYRMREDLLQLKMAIEDAQNIILHNREALHRIYRECMKDPHYISQWGTRKLKTMQRKFKIVSAADEQTEDKAATKALKALWFYKLIEAMLESIPWGFTLLEFGPVIDGKPRPFRAKNGRIYEAINVIERDNVKPEFGYIGAEPSSNSGVPFDTGAFADNMIFVGSRSEFGLMLSLVKYILFKDNCAENWSEWAEIFGQDVRVGKTASEGTMRQRFLKALREMGSSGYAVIDPDDSIEFAGTSRTDAYKVYDSFMERIDSNISRAVFGQDVVSNNTGHVIGEVGENVSNLYGDADALLIELTVNDILPKLTKLGIYDFTGLQFMWDVSEKLGLKDRSDVDKKVSEMGWRPTAKYVTDTYGTEVDPEPTNPVQDKPDAQTPGQKKATERKVKVENALKELYASAAVE